mgnify:CR=1 FL=1
MRLLTMFSDPLRFPYDRVSYLQYVWCSKQKTSVGFVMKSTFIYKYEATRQPSSISQY